MLLLTSTHFDEIPWQLKAKMGGLGTKMSHQSGPKLVLSLKSSPDN